MNRFVTSDGLGLAWQEEGAGLPLLCLPMRILCPPQRCSACSS